MELYFSGIVNVRGFHDIETTTFKGVDEDLNLEAIQDKIGESILPYVKKKFSIKRGTENFYECYLTWKKNTSSNIKEERLFKYE
jgi:hypothetical protein